MIGAMTTEHKYPTEEDARQARRVFIMTGHSVSLIAYDPSRRVYTFDVYS